MFNRSGEGGHPCLFLVITRGTSSFCLFSITLAVGFSKMAYIVLRYVPSMPSLLRFFFSFPFFFFFKSWGDVKFYLSPFLCLLRWSCVFVSSSVYLMNHIYSFAYGETTLHSRNKAYLIVVVFWRAAIFNLLIFCWGFLHLSSSGISAWSFCFFVVSLPRFGIRMMLTSQNELGRNMYSLIFFRIISVALVSVLLYMSGRIELWIYVVHGFFWLVGFLFF